MAVRDIVLIVSLIANVFVIGFVVGGKTAGLKVVHPSSIEQAADRQVAPQHPLPIDPRRALRFFDEERRIELRAGISADIRTLRPKAAAAVRARARVLETLSAEPFDRGAADEAVQALADAERALTEATQTAFLNFYGSLTPEEQAILREVIKNRVKEQFMNRRRGGGRDRSGPPPPPPPPSAQ
ncbi:MAG: periplasmic heavy metal sensor [Pseudomonadota bacterium]